MDSSNPAKAFFAEEQLTDTEAEAALLALGEALEWSSHYRAPAEDTEWQKLMQVMKKVQPGPQTDAKILWYREQKNTVRAALTARGYYSVRIRRRWLRCCTYTACYLLTSPHDIGQHPQQFRSLVDAQIACERHHATGSWD